MRKEYTKDNIDEVDIWRERVKNNLYFWAHLYKGSQDP